MRRREAPETLPDRELVGVYRADPGGTRGRAAASELFGRYRDRLYLWCLRHMREHEAALDLAQETLLAAFRALPGFEGRSEFSSWLFAIARYRCASARRAPRLLAGDGVDPDTIPSLDRGPEEEFLARADEEKVLALLNTALDRDERAALWLRYYERMPVDEITTILGLKGESGARGLLQRGRRKLRGALLRSEAGRGEGEK
jgi:RNA polymerase sigma-70 factor (ECF subfamily)